MRSSRIEDPLDGCLPGLLERLIFEQRSDQGLEVIIKRRRNLLQRALERIRTHHTIVAPDLTGIRQGQRAATPRNAGPQGALGGRSLSPTCGSVGDGTRTGVRAPVG